MTAITLRLTNATGTSSLLMEVNENASIADVLTALCERLGFSASDSQGAGKHWFHSPLQEMVLYNGRIGVFDPDKTLQQSRIASSDALRWYFRPAPAFASLSNIKLMGGQKLKEALVLVVVEWRDKCYPIVLPATITPQGNVEGSLLSQVVFKQIAAIEGQATIAKEGLRAWRYRNTRTQQRIDPYDTTVPLNHYLNYGDLVKIRSTESAWSVEALADEISIVDDVDDQITIEDSPSSQRAEQDILGQIELSPSEPGPKAEGRKKGVRATVNGAKLALVLGDITQQRTDAIVNAANEALKGGGGVDNAIHQAAGPQLVKASQLLAPCRPGKAVLTPGFCLPAKWVIHTVGPVYQGGIHRERKTLANAYHNSLTLANNSRFSSIAFPSISTGAYHYPIAKAAKIALKTAVEFLKRPQSQLKLVRFVLFSDSDYEHYHQALGQLASR